MNSCNGDYDDNDDDKQAVPLHAMEALGGEEV
jgi:hypothetical protein